MQWHHQYDITVFLYVLNFPHWPHTFIAIHYMLTLNLCQHTLWQPVCTCVRTYVFGCHGDYGGTTWSKPSATYCVHTCVCRRAIKEATIHRSTASETAAMTAGTPRGVSLFLRPDTPATTPLTGESHLSTHTTHAHVVSPFFACLLICFLLFWTVWTLLALAPSTVLLLMWWIEATVMVGSDKSLLSRRNTILWTLERARRPFSPASSF